MSSDTSITENENDTNNNINNNSNDNHARLPSLILSTRLEERSIAPIFDGTQWAGTRVWKAAILAVEYLIRLKQTNKNMLGSSSLLELGCGLGVPGMIWKQLLLQEQKIMGSSDNNNGRVVLTDRDSLITQLETNIENNFHVNDNIIASPLDWSTDVTSVERRNQDNLEGFLTKLKCSGVIGNIDCVITDNTDPHHIIEIYVTKGIE
ncbi:hypothetical protein FRACYDRAFT_249477 [Fragilariopsis cylindrus CCMP1102]|uniref:Uncharacterized protein n=1 Tax=Fragilariopsis cylindrus CCMP1102 TaxID=635003 RepID=A0A1E7ESQ0_9STRA|nr:hypothetical protein FRACYDRAFT_249477 [Fragilariopsis cylindrus CCMP1102]|eukprot:OEU08583.1 hypothetical protein FRACYDRAFT_249477 [Fragilariopsis cylindrus CCMP1102]